MSKQRQRVIKIDAPFKTVREDQTFFNSLLVPHEAQEARGVSEATRIARMLLRTHAGAVAFSRTADPATGAAADIMPLATFGEVNLSALGS